MELLKANQSEIKEKSEKKFWKNRNPARFQLILLILINTMIVIGEPLQVVTISLIPKFNGVKPEELLLNMTVMSMILAAFSASSFILFILGQGVDSVDISKFTLYICLFTGTHKIICSRYIIDFDA